MKCCELTRINDCRGEAVLQNIAELFDEEQTSTEVIKAFSWYLIGYADCLERAGENY